MNSIHEHLAQMADESPYSGQEVLRQHGLEGILRRIARLPHPEKLVLRGGMLTHIWAKPRYRPSVDIDYVGNFPFNLQETTQYFQQAFDDSTHDEIHDEVVFRKDDLIEQPIWQKTAFPGVRYRLQAKIENYRFDFSIDVGFNDPLSPPPELFSYPVVWGDPVRLWAVKRETMIGWKFHGLVEKGKIYWRAKDLHDLWLLLQFPGLNPSELRDAICVAFESRGYLVASGIEFLQAPWWQGKQAQHKWSTHLQKFPKDEIPESVVEIVNSVSNFLKEKSDIFGNISHPSEKISL